MAVDSGSVPGSTVMWVNGELVAPDRGMLRPDDHALVGDGVFEAVKVSAGVPFAITRHLRRLEVSARPLGIEIDETQLRAAIHAVLATPQAQASPCWLRITVTGGSAPFGTGRVGGRPTVVAAVAPMRPWAATTSVVVVPWTRNEHGATAGLKTISYADNVIALRDAHRRGAEEAIFANTAGNLCEGTGTNVFVRVGDRLVTPTLASGCLPGVTRALLLEWMPDVVEQDMPIGALRDASEAFLTSTSRDVHPIATVDGNRLAMAPGPLTQRARAVWRDNAARDTDP
jgi:branched-chain amino acid aminotransferase